MPLSTTQSESNSTGIIAVTACLMTVGLVMVASAGATLDQPVLRLAFWKSSFGRQAIFTLVGFVTLLVISQGGHRLLRWRENGWFQPSVALVVITAVCLVMVLVPGVGAVRNGARRWLQLGPAGGGLSFQPSELAKLALVVFLAAFLSSRWRRIGSFRHVTLPACGVLGGCVALVGIEDFGTAALLASVGGAMLIAGGVRWRHVVLLGFPLVAAMAYLIVREPYRMRRLMVFLDIWSDPRGDGYHPIQSLITIASGEMTGRGLGAGIQKYGYLPASRNDFIFSVICEETGMIGGACVIALFVAFLWLGWRVASRGISPFGRLLAFGVTLMLTMQALINIAVVTVCAPTKGISLPLVSAGGSGVILLGVMVGLLVSVAREPACETCVESRGFESPGVGVPVVQP